MRLALVGLKGGAGKSTVAISVAAELHSRGRRVLLIDADPQQTALAWSGRAAELNQPAPTVLAIEPGAATIERLSLMAGGFDDVVVDCPGRLDRTEAVQKAAMMVADVVLAPCGPSQVDAWALGTTAELMKRAQLARPELVAAVLVTRKAARTVIGQGAREALEVLGLPVLSTELGYRVAFQEAPAAGLGVAQYDGRGEAGAEVRALVAELEQMAKGKRRKAAAGR